MLIMTVASKMPGDESYWSKNQKLIQKHVIFESHWSLLSCLANWQATNWKNEFSLSLIKLGVNLIPRGFFQKCTFYRKREALFFITFKVTFLKISSKLLTSFRTYEDFLLQYYLFSSIFRILSHFLVTSKLMRSPNNRWCQHYFTIIRS